MTTCLRTYALLFFILLVGTKTLQAQTSTITSFTPSKGSVGTLVTITGNNLSNPTSIKIGGVNAIAISNTGTKLVAMVMPGAVSGHVSVIAGKDTVTSGNSFSVVASKLPNKQRGTKLVGNNPTSATFQGISSALSADGGTAIVSGINSLNDLGVVWVYTRNSSGVWIQQGNGLTIDGTPAAGYFAAISADGNQMIVAGDDKVGSRAAWVYNRIGVSRSEVAKLVPVENTALSGFGSSVAFSADGNTAVIGGLDKSVKGPTAWIFTQNKTGNWAQSSKLIVTGATGGAPVSGLAAISADGTTAVIGSPNDGVIGSAWIFRKISDSSWKQCGESLTLPFPTSLSSSLNTFGSSVAINADGSTVVIGCPGDSSMRGAVYVYTRSNDTTWLQQGGRLVGSIGGTFPSPQQGFSVSVSADGNNLVSGGFADDGFIGAMWVFARDKNGVWAQQSKLIGSGAVGLADQGYSVAISADGNTAIEGGILDSSRGAAWIFTDSTATILPVTLTNFTAHSLGKGVQTAWTGYDEINMQSYDIERSTNGYQFAKVGNVPAKGNEGAENEYLWFDANPLTGDNFYRIKAISKDATFQYSKIVKVNIGDGKTGMFIYPNPVINKTIQLQVNNVAAGTYAIAVYNTAGQKVYSGSYVHAAGNATVAVSVKGAASGIYHVEMLGGNNKYSSEVVVR